MRRVPLILVLATVALCAQTGVAAAATYYVNGATGDDTYDCLAPTGTGPAGPCDTIDHALDLAELNPGSDEVRVASGAYSETLTVGDGTLLRQLDSAGPDPDINSPSAVAAAVTITAGGGSIDGFDITSPYMHVSVNGPGSIINNDMPTTGTTTNQNINVSAVTGSVLIANNDIGDDGIGAQQGIFSTATSATNLTIQENLFGDLNIAIWLQAGDSSPLIADNLITGLHTSGTGVEVYQGSPAITNNTIGAPGAGGALGVRVTDTVGPAGATLSRNTITGLSSGVSFGGTSLAVRLNSDLIAGNAAFGLQAAEGNPGTGDVTATNVTTYDNATADIRVQDNHLILDSSIVGNPISVNGTTSTCAISSSRGPTLIGNATGCGTFQTIADPMFANPAMDDYHLLAGSPMIDAGNPLPPDAGVLDVDGDPRALDATPACSGNVNRRDIGADEFVAALPTGCITAPAAALENPECQRLRNKLKKAKTKKKKRKIRRKLRRLGC